MLLNTRSGEVSIHCADGSTVRRFLTSGRNGMGGGGGGNLLQSRSLWAGQARVKSIIGVTLCTRNSDFGHPVAQSLRRSWHGARERERDWPVTPRLRPAVMPLTPPPSPSLSPHCMRLLQNPQDEPWRALWICRAMSIRRIIALPAIYIIACLYRRGDPFANSLNNMLLC